MIKLPKETVNNLVEELENLISLRDNAPDENRIQEINDNNNAVMEKISQRENLIKSFQDEIENLKKELIDLPQATEVDDNKIKELTEMLILSGYYTKVVREDGEYLEETGEYAETPEVQDVVKIEEE